MEEDTGRKRQIGKDRTMILLSSRWTFFYKYVFPTVWIAGFGFGTLALWAGLMDDPEAATPEMRWVFLVTWIAGTVFILWFTRRLKRVSVEGPELVVSSDGEEVRIPLTAVAEVRETRFWSPKMIEIRLDRPVAYPDQIVFAAPMAFQWPFTDHPVVKELNLRIQQAKTSPES